MDGDDLAQHRSTHTHTQLCSAQTGLLLLPQHVLTDESSPSAHLNVLLIKHVI